MGYSTRSLRPLCSTSSQPSSMSMFGRAVLAHRAELDQVDVAVDVGDRVHHVERADDVVGLRVDRVLLVDHRVRRSPLLAEMDDRVGRELADHRVHEVGSQRSPTYGLIALPQISSHSSDPLLERRDRHKALDAHLLVVAATGEVVADGHIVAEGGQMEGRGPPEVPVTA